MLGYGVQGCVWGYEVMNKVDEAWKIIEQGKRNIIVFHRLTIYIP